MPDREEIVPGSPEERRRGDINVLQYQVGALQSALDRGLGALEKSLETQSSALERSLEKGFDSINVRIDKLDARMATVEERQAFDAARLKALEQFREEADRREDQRRQAQEIETKQLVDSSQQAKTLRLIGGLLVTAITVIGIVVAILTQLGGP